MTSYLEYKPENIKSSDVVKRLTTHIIKKSQKCPLFQKKKGSTATGNWIHKDDIYNKNDVTLRRKKLIDLCEKKKVGM